MCELKDLHEDKPLLIFCDWVKKNPTIPELKQHWEGLMEGTEIQVDLTWAKTLLEHKTTLSSVRIARVPLEAAKDGKQKTKTKSKAKATAETKLNKYGFIHIPKDLIKELPFKPETRLKLIITPTQLRIEKAAK